MGLLDSLMPTGGLLGLGGFNSGAGMYNQQFGPLLGGAYDPAMEQKIKLKNLLIGAGLGLLGQKASSTPITFGDTLASGIGGGINQATQAADQYRQNAVAATQLQRQLQQSQQQLDLGKQQLAQGDITTQNMAHPENVKSKPTWGVIGQDQYTGAPIYGFPPQYDPNNPQGPSQTQQAPWGNPAQPPMGQPDQSQPPPPQQGGVPGGQGMVAQAGQMSPPQPQGNGILPPQGAASNLHGEDFLKSINPVLADNVRSIAVGLADPPNDRQQYTPQGRAVMSALRQYDPLYMPGQGVARKQMLSDIATGKIGNANNAQTTALQHLQEMKDVADQLNNYHSGSWLSSPLNEAGLVSRQLSQDPIISRFETVKNQLASELTNIYGEGTESAIGRKIALLSPSSSPEQINAVISEMANLMKGKITGNQQQYDQAMGPYAGGGRKLVNDQTTALLDKLSKVGSESTAAPQKTPQPGEGRGGNSQATAGQEVWTIGPDGKPVRVQ